MHYNIHTYTQLCQRCVRDRKWIDSTGIPWDCFLRTGEKVQIHLAKFERYWATRYLQVCDAPREAPTSRSTLHTQHLTYEIYAYHFRKSSFSCLCCLHYDDALRFFYTRNCGCLLLPIIILRPDLKVKCILSTEAPSKEECELLPESFPSIASTFYRLHHNVPCADLSCPFCFPTCAISAWSL